MKKKNNEDKIFMKGYKAFDKGLICRGKQYKENEIFEENDAKICNCGMHFCKEPLGVLEYYPLVNENGKISEFAEVEALDECLTDDNQKYCTKKLKINVKIDFSKLVQIAVNFDYSNEKELLDTDIKNDNGGDGARIGSSGNGARIGSSGNYAQINSTGKDSVIMCAGNNSIAKAKNGSWITLSEWEYDDDKKRYIPINVITKKVDGKEIKEDTYYKLINGKFVEVDK